MSARIEVDPSNQSITGERSLRESGSSLVITIPPEIYEALEWESGDPICLTAQWDEDTITMEPKNE